MRKVNFMKSLLVIIFTFICYSLIAQKPIPPTENFSIEGKVKKVMMISLPDLSSYKSYSIDSILITNHLGERRSTLKNVKGILLKDILNKVEIEAEAPKP